MSKSYDFGVESENRAVKYLVKSGYKILARNYRYLKAEIDIIALKENILVVVEVKARSASIFGNPEDAVSSKKIKLLVLAADHFIQTRELNYNVRFDVITYVVEKQKWTQNHIENAFYSFE